MNEKLNEALEQISDKHIQEAAHRKRNWKPFFGVVAALLALVIAAAALWPPSRKPSTHLSADPTISKETKSNTPHIPVLPPDSPQGSSPSSYFRFTSVGQINDLFLALNLNDEAFEAHVHTLSIHPFSPVEDLRSSTLNFRTLLTAVPLPCHDVGFSLVNYYYGWNGVELIYDINGIRYQILFNFDVAPYSGQPVMRQVSLGDLSLDLYLDEGRLKGIADRNGYQIHISCFTDDPQQVDLSGFVFRLLLENISTGPVVVPLSGLVSAPTYPQRLRHPYLPGGSKWPEYNAQFQQPQGYANSLTSFFKDGIRHFLVDGNSACSPLNVYMALAMLAEASGGNTRQQILDLLGHDSIESLRTQAGYVWNAHYQADGATSLTLANSLWLSNRYRFVQDTADILASRYYSAVYTGDLGTEEMNKLLRDWLDTQTGGLLTEQIQDIQLDPATIFALASTVYYRVQWSTKFNEANNTVGSFHTPSGEKDATFMHQTLSNSVYYYGESYGAVALELEDGGHMWIVLPDEDLTPHQLLEQGDCLSMILDGQGASKEAEILLSLPKFDITSNTDLSEALQAMGVTDAFSAGSADFSPLTQDTENLFVDRVAHGVRVAADEDGLTAAAYTIISAPSAGMPEQLEQIAFDVNRPFLFVITSRDGLPLFAGTVQEP